MSRERTGMFGAVVVTMIVTSAALVAGYFGAQRYFATPTVDVPHQEAPAAPAPKKKSRTPPKNGRAIAHESAASNGAAATPVDETAAGARADSEPTTANTAASAPAEDVDHPDARTIMVETQRRSEAKYYRYDGLLESFDAKNKVTEKRWTFDRQGSNGQSKSVVRLTSPTEAKGVALLIHNHPDRASEQWMWSPAIERDRRIAAQDRSTRFFGTDFSFEDLEERDVDQYDYSLLGNETIDGVDCWKIQSVPRQSRTSQYTHSIAWVRKDNYAVVRLDNFVKDEVIRRQTFANIENIQGIWTARLLEISEPRRHSRTRLTLQQVRYNSPMKDEEFTLQAIRR